MEVINIWFYRSRTGNTLFPYDFGGILHLCCHFITYVGLQWFASYGFVYSTRTQTPNIWALCRPYLMQNADLMLGQRHNDGPRLKQHCGGDSIGTSESSRVFISFMARQLI